jgi:hypothetical protein
MLQMIAMRPYLRGPADVEKSKVLFSIAWLPDLSAGSCISWRLYYALLSTDEAN